MALSLTTLWPLSYLLLAVADDLLFKKFHNWLFLSLTGLGLTIGLLLPEITITHMFMGFFCGGALILPLTLLGAIGAGDMKFMMCLGLVLGPLAVTNVFLFSLIWGSLLGVIKTLLQGQIKTLALNLINLKNREKINTQNQIPYTVAIFFGWLSWASYGGLL